MYIRNFLLRFFLVGLACFVLIEPVFFSMAQNDEFVCKSSIDGDVIHMNKVCLQQDMYPKINDEEVLKLIWNKIDTINKVYDIDQPEFEFNGSTLSSNSIVPLSYYKEKYIHYSNFSDFRDSIASETIEIPLETLAMEQFKTYGIVAADRDISKYGDCATQNFMVGMKAMDHIVVDPGKTRNANKTFAHLPGYCTGSSSQEYMFYQGICGVSSMAFRASMLDPSVTILKRSGHTKWFTKYYGDMIYGDDAAIYENIKQFEIRNDSDYPLYMKSKIIGDRPYLMFISPRPLTSKVQLKKEQTGPLSARIERNFMRDGKIITESWNSEYAVKTEEGN